MAYPYRHEKETRVLSECFGDPSARTVAGWRKHGGYQGIARALEIGLVDGLGSLPDAVSAAAELADLTDYGIKRFTTPLSPRDVLIQQLLDSAEVAPPVHIPGALRKAWALAESLNDPKDTYAICEPCLGLMP